MENIYTRADKIGKSRNYIKSIRNRNKQEYAGLLLKWYMDREDQKPFALMPEPASRLHFMTKQAVQIKFHEIWYEVF